MGLALHLEQYELTPMARGKYMTSHPGNQRDQIGVSPASWP